MDYLTKILNARVYDVAVETPLELAANLSARCGNRLLLKREDMQPVFSFNSDGIFAGVSGALKASSGGIGRLSRWQDLLQRARAEGFE